MGDEAEADRISGRRSVDDGARLLIAENSLLRVDKRLDTLAEGQSVVSSVLLGALHKDGTTTPGLVQQVGEIRQKQDDNGEKIDGVLVDMGDLKTAQADQAKTLAEHGNALEEIRGWIKAGVGYLKSIALWVGRGVAGAIGMGALWLLGQWVPSIVNFFMHLLPAADAATRGR